MSGWGSLSYKQESSEVVIILFFYFIIYVQRTTEKAKAGKQSGATGFGATRFGVIGEGEGLCRLLDKK